jgi:hypothetical protein
LANLVAGTLVEGVGMPLSPVYAPSRPPPALSIATAPLVSSKRQRSSRPGGGGGGPQAPFTHLLPVVQPSSFAHVVAQLAPLQT